MICRFGNWWIYDLQVKAFFVDLKLLQICKYILFLLQIWHTIMHKML